MRVKEFIPESWWDDLDDDFLTMMGYAISSDEGEIDPSLEVKAMVKDYRQKRY